VFPDYDNAMEKVMLSYLWSRFHRESLAGLVRLLSGKITILEKNGSAGKGREGVTNCKAEAAASRRALTKGNMEFPTFPKGTKRHLCVISRLGLSHSKQMKHVSEMF